MISRYSEERIQLLVNNILCNTGNADKEDKEETLQDAYKRVILNEKEEPKEKPVELKPVKMHKVQIKNIAPFAISGQLESVDSYVNNLNNFNIEYKNKPGNWAGWAHIVVPGKHVIPLDVTVFIQNLINKVQRTNVVALRSLINKEISIPEKIIPGLAIISDSGYGDQKNIILHSLNPIIYKDIFPGHSMLSPILHREFIKKTFKPKLATKYADYYVFSLAEFLIRKLWGTSLSISYSVEEIKQLLKNNGITNTNIFIVFILPRTALYSNALNYFTFRTMDEYTRKTLVFSGDKNFNLTCKDFFDYEGFLCREADNRQPGQKTKSRASPRWEDILQTGPRRYDVLSDFESIPEPEAPTIRRPRRSA